MTINTVNGPADTADFGVTLMHEHLLSLDMQMVHAYADWYDKEQMMRDFCDSIARVKAHGVQTFVDQTPINLGRDIHLLREAAERADIRILCATGLYFMEEPFIMRDVDPRRIAFFLMRDICDGIQGTRYRAALVKCATDKYRGESDVNRAMVRGCGMAARQTGVPIATHTQSKLHHGLYQQQVLLEEGVEPHKICIGHTFDCLEEDYVCRLMDAGSYVGCDQIGIVHRATTQQYADFVAKLIHMGRGYEKQIFLSHDASMVSDYAYEFSPRLRDREKNTAAAGGYDELFANMLPMLLERGVSPEQIDTMLVENPRRFFEGIPFS